MFRPMAFTVSSALFGALILALIVIPVLTSLVFSKGLPIKATPEKSRWVERVANQAHHVVAQAGQVDRGMRLSSSTREFEDPARELRGLRRRESDVLELLHARPGERRAGVDSAGVSDGGNG